MRNDAKLRTYTVGALAKLSGISIRTLHHYDAIGLLKPASVGENGYRRYGREELLRLQQILFHRELGMSLTDIAAVLDAPDFDRLAALRRQRESVRARADRDRRLLETIDRTIAELIGELRMSDKRLFDGFEPEKQAEYEAYIIAQYGEDARKHIDRGRQRMSEMTAEEMQAHLSELSDIEDDLAKAVEAGVAPDDPLLDPVLARHHRWVGAAWASPPSAEAYTGLGMLYASHPDFITRYESQKAGFATWLKVAISAFARRNLS
jgi:DNA-binding transcriptional MerR regulator